MRLERTANEALELAGRELSAGRFEEVERICREILAADQTCAAAWRLRGAAALRAGDFRLAEECAQGELALLPESAEAHNNWGTALLEQGRWDEAAGCFRRAIELNPTYALAHYNLGNALKSGQHFQEAAACYCQAKNLRPDFAWAHASLARMHLLLGDFKPGWIEYEWRWTTGEVEHSELAGRKWAGESLSGRAILLWAEQGFGDTFQFIRYAPLVKRLGATVLVRCQRALIPVLSRCAGIDQLIAEGDSLPAFDVHAPLLSLPGIVGTTLESIPAEGPYLLADPALVCHWRETLKGIRGFRVGINWRGRADRIELRKRDIPIELMASLADVPGVQLIRLQRGAGQEDIQAAGGKLPVIDFGNLDTEHGAFMDTAAILQNVDLVISSDTAVPHLAGALGVPVWVALPSAPDWRWLLDRSDSPWYPTMRLFRQKMAGDWTAVFDAIRSELLENVSRKTAASLL